MTMNFPNRTIHIILSFLRPIERAKAGETCRQWRAVCCADHLWLDTLYSEFPVARRYNFDKHREIFVRAKKYQKHKRQLGMDYKYPPFEEWSKGKRVTIYKEPKTKPLCYIM
eukprot:gb/GECH01004307.1/.p1 GENE.gb/GECH01004307.1/~~gb/GECH01004307.1/.p1  ORF type:complete len:112 (+),score=12.26 gb/GECH01004307.1/:1-336(+)